MSKTLGIEWLKANDPTYVSPAMKASETKRTEWSVESALAYVGGDGCYKASKTGKRVSLDSSVSFSGVEGNYTLEVEDNNNPESAIMEKEQNTGIRRKGGDKAGQKRRNRERKRQAKRERILNQVK